MGANSTLGRMGAVQLKEFLPLSSLCSIFNFDYVVDLFHLNAQSLGVWGTSERSALVQDRVGG